MLVLSDKPGNFFALKTEKGFDFTSRRQIAKFLGAILEAGDEDFISVLCGLGSTGSASSSFASLSSSKRLKLSLNFPSCRTERSGKMKYPPGVGRSKYAIPATGIPVSTGKEVAAGPGGTRPCAI